MRIENNPIRIDYSEKGLLTRISTHIRPLRPCPESYFSLKIDNLTSFFVQKQSEYMMCSSMAHKARLAASKTDCINPNRDFESKRKRLLNRKHASSQHGRGVFRLFQIKPICIHHFPPSGNKVTDKFLFIVILRIHFC